MPSVNMEGVICEPAVMGPAVARSLFSAATEVYAPGTTSRWTTWRVSNAFVLTRSLTGLPAAIADLATTTVTFCWLS